MGGNETNTREPGISRSGIRRAITEFAVIVTGVLTALAVDGWASGRREAALQQEYLQRLEQDLVANLAMFENSERFYQRVAGRAEHALNLMEGTTPVDRPSQALAAFYHASRGDSPDFVDATYQELVATGSLRLIRDVSLRTALARYHVLTRGYLENFSGWDDRNPYRDRVRRLIPARIQATLIAACPLEADNPTKCDFATSEAAANAALRRLLSDEELHLHLIAWVAAQGNIAVRTQRQREQTQALLNQVREAM